MVSRGVTVSLFLGQWLVCVSFRIHCHDAKMRLKFLSVTLYDYESTYRVGALALEFGLYQVKIYPSRLQVIKG